MIGGNQESQLELFDVASRPTPRPHRDLPGRLVLQVRHDQFILVSMAALIGLTIIFACGVERGKELVRSERALLARQETTTPPPSHGVPSGQPLVVVKPLAATPAPTKVDPRAEKGERRPQTPVTAPKAREPGKPASGKSRYAIQVVSFSRPFLAKKELDRLQALGERAFLVMRDGRTVVYVGPFPSRVNATEKLADLKSHYQDCFMRNL